MNFDLRKPCSNCPFRSDRPFHLHPQRALDIMSGDHTFACHKTVDYNKSDDGEGVTTPKSQHCAGLLILRERMDRPTQMMRIAERIGLYDRTKLDMNSPVFQNIDEAMASFRTLNGEAHDGTTDPQADRKATRTRPSRSSRTREA